MPTYIFQLEVIKDNVLKKRKEGIIASSESIARRIILNLFLKEGWQVKSIKFICVGISM